MAKKKLKQLNPRDFLEIYSNPNDDSFEAGYLLKREGSFILVRDVNTIGCLSSYSVINTDLDNYYFRTNTKYLKMLVYYDGFAKKKKVKGTPKMAGVENISFKKPLKETLYFLMDNQIVCDIVIKNRKKNEKELITCTVKKIEKKKIVAEVLNDDNPFDEKLTENENVKLKKIENVSFNDWNNIFRTELLKK